MSRINLLTILIVAWVVLGSVSNVQAIQWPVNSGPIHQAVPQYRPRYPLAPLSEPKPNPIPKLKFERVDPIADAVRRRPIELLNPEPAQANAVLHPAAQPSVGQPSPQPTTAGQPSNIASTNREPLQFETPRPATPKTDLPTVSKSSPKKTLAKKADAKKTDARKKKEKQNRPVVNYDVYRDRNPLPIDPRKPCSICTNPNLNGGCGCGQHCDAPGLYGKPYQEREPGGCRCGDKKCGKCSPMFSLNWPRPLSAKLDEHFPSRAAERYSPCQKKRIVDVFDKFANFKLVDYQRKDNGYCGEDADRYGCLGESRMVASGVSGVGYRFPSVPVDRSASLEATGFNWR